MRLFRDEEEDFDDSAAFESDNSGIIKTILLVIVGIVLIGAISWFGYTAYQNRSISNNDTNTTIPYINGTNQTLPLNPKNIIVNFSTFNLSVRENPQGVYYYTTQEKVTGEKCYIDGVVQSCSKLTNSICAEQTCKKDLVTITECFVNNEKINCP